MTVSRRTLEIVLQPVAKSRHTTCKLAVVIDGEAAWPVLREEDAWLEIQIDDLLGHLTDFWKPLMLRQVYPIDVTPLRPSDLCRDAERRWAELPPEVVEKEEEAVSAFEEAHDLARAFAGMFGLPPLWVMRSGEEMVIETAGALWRLPFDSVRASLSATGDLICERLGVADGVRWRGAIEAWRGRDDVDKAGLLAWSAGLDRALALVLIEEGTLEAPRDFNDAANDDDELRIAARMAGALPVHQIREVIALARQFPEQEAAHLRQLADACSGHLAIGFARAAPFVQGEAAARFVRDKLRMPADDAVDIFTLLADLGVDVRSALAEPPTLDGLAIWGKRHGPGVFLNQASGRIRPQQAGDRVEVSFGARVTLAHEFCHLLLDGRHALSAVEVLKARMPAGVEQRAKSFAGEFLLPRHVAAEQWLVAGRPLGQQGIEAVVVELTERFGVTRSVAAWKLEHGAALYGEQLGPILDAVAPRR
jgi:hypothetical protein